MGFWQSFLGFDPNRQASFPGQQEGEEVELMTVLHSMCLIPLIFQILLALILIAFLWLNGFSELFSKYQQLALGSILLSLLFHIICFRLYNYFLKVLIITNYRIIDIRHTVFLHRERDVLPMNFVHDFRYFQDGILSRIFHYGTLEILGSSSEVKFRLHHIPHVNKIHHLLGEIHQHFLRGHQSTEYPSVTHEFEPK